MKKLYIVRHTHKALEKPGQDDYDRELSQEGLEEAKLIAQKLSNTSIKTDLIVSSPAVRTRQTAEIFADILEYDKSIMYNEVLYLAFVNELLETISYTFDTVDTMILIGHNPSLTALAITLIDFKEKFEIGGVMEIEFDCNSWIDISKENAKLVSYILPDK
ncbi:SixA phosphatase family protein [Poseidonibacter ostreae]|jgi:phosphohistidine phosphatase|uniref:Phosphoglycerate mutase n=1 Tax=Poseidonibacter ostreae TaxID=2654171 RepID=A0A6L4WW28_9BACT|nr:histidine phosphatase family protein [Poseidonibacter ostreae]KAB7884830.1 phosphoglycerate mutase [Poseidonibacter ostreae]KAB7890150.1 phosphoglycerate mutase [Poseidonibacter ostreae]KAB7892612.1 phosphoglycerate mutase [Poseidonibacter ostreae]MAC84422.1 phosphoglycerate mutase [Arcobacter sp.]|tara:strand:+ start:4270 stop:4752 length:483 start_codon:yes stop_codon:yes gene_type:complete